MPWKLYECSTSLTGLHLNFKGSFNAKEGVFQNLCKLIVL